jgi:hypothetical protein
MKEKTKTQSQLLVPTKDFWRALLVVYNYYLVEEIARPYERADRPPRHVQDSLRFLDCCLDLAISEGWMNDAH